MSLISMLAFFYSYHQVSFQILSHPHIYVYIIHSFYKLVMIQSLIITDRHNEAIEVSLFAGLGNNIKWCCLLFHSNYSLFPYSISLCTKTNAYMAFNACAFSLLSNIFFSLSFSECEPWHYEGDGNIHKLKSLIVTCSHPYCMKQRETVENMCEKYR